MSETGILREAVALITGAGSGIGAATARRFSDAGAQVHLVGRNCAKLDAVAASVPAAGVHVCDVREESAVEALVDSIGDVDVLVNAAGVIVATPVHETSVSAFDDLMATNLRGAFLLSRRVLPGMRERGRGTLVNISSVVVQRSFALMGAYAAAKAGLRALSGVICEENRAHGIRVLDVIPGATSTPIWDGFWKDAPHERMMAPDDVAGAIVHALTGVGGAMVEEMVLRPQGGDL